MKVGEMEAGYELNVLVAQAMGWTRSEQQPHIFHDEVGHCYVVQKDWHPRCPHTMFLPSTDIAAAWLVLEKLSSSWLPSVYHDGQLWICEFYDLKKKVIASAPTPELAICLCALKASNETLLS